MEIFLIFVGNLTAMRTILSLLVPLVIITGVLCDSSITLQTNLGPISGLSSSIVIRNVTKYYTVFKKVPFAKPPVGDLKFRKPVPHGPWNGTLRCNQLWTFMYSATRSTSGPVSH
jgi:hypothetical protein